MSPDAETAYAQGQADVHMSPKDAADKAETYGYRAGWYRQGYRDAVLVPAYDGGPRFLQPGGLASFPEAKP